MGIVAQLVLFVLSSAYQIQQQKKMKRKMEAEADKRKGSIFTVQNENISLPVVYGRQMLGGVQYDHRVSGSYSYAAPEEGTYLFDSKYDFPNEVGASSLLTSVVNPEVSAVSSTKLTNAADSSGSLSATVTGTKNEFMFAKHAICHGGIDSVRHVLVDNKAWNHREFQKGNRIQVYTDGGTSNLLQSNGYPSTDKFSNVCYAAEVFRLDRDKQNYSGAPDVQFLVHGQKVRTISESLGVYTLSTARTYSNNPAYVLLDYLTNNNFGRGLSDSEIDLESFYNAAQICDTVVLSGAEVSGGIFGSKPISNYPTFADFPSPNAWGFEEVILKDDSTSNVYIWEKTGGTDDEPTGQFVQISGLPTRDIPLYEANLTLNTEESIRDNIETILNTMNYAELVWSTEGKYKLLLEYPENATETSALVVKSFTDTNIMRDSFSITFPAADDRLNFATVNFLNEHNNFKTDTASWPEKGSAVHTTYLTEDNSQPFETSVKADGVSDPYHALAQAEQSVRASRSLYTVNFKTDREGLVLEPGDFISVTLEEAGLDTATIFRVQEIKVNENFTVDITAYFFDEQVLAWNVADGIDYPTQPVYVKEIEPVTNLTVGSPVTDNPYDIATLSWDYDESGSAGLYLYEIFFKTSASSDYEFLAQTKYNEYSFGLLKGMPATTIYDFKVYVRSPVGSRSIATEITSQDITIKPDPVSSLSVTESLYITNNASGVKSKALLSWSASTGIKAQHYEVLYKLTTDATYQVYNTVDSTSIEIFDLAADNYNFRIIPFSHHDIEGDPTTTTKTIVGLTAVPNDPTNLTGNITEGQISLSWDLATDLDVLFGGSVQIRHHIATDGSASWDSASIIVESISGNSNNKTVPVLQGTFFIKFVDSSGNYSTNAASFISTFQDKTFNQVETLDEATPGFLGTKTNCTVVSGNLELDSGQTDMEYIFNDVVDLGEVVTVRVSPTIVASVTDRSTTVASYTNVSLVQNFAGPFKNASLQVYVSTTDDDPTGTPTWSAYELLTIGNFTCRALRFKFEGIANDTNTLISISELSILVDKKDITKYGSSTSSTSADTTVTFTDAFYGGPGGTNNPTIGLQVIGGSQGDEVVIASRSKTGFSYSIYNGGSRVLRDVDWQAIGQ